MQLDDLNALLARAEFHKTLKVQAEACDAATGCVTLHLPFDSAYTLFAEMGNYHGGVVAALADVAGTMACTVKAGRPTPTLDLRIDYLKTACKVDLIAEARARKVGRSVGIADVTVTDANGTVFALARGTFSTADTGG